MLFTKQMTAAFVNVNASVIVIGGRNTTAGEIELAEYFSFGLKVFPLDI